MADDRTKGTGILATLGPASATTEQIRALAEAGADGFRINFSHGDPDERERYLTAIREVERDLGRPIVAVADLCGPKIRVGPLEGGEITLESGQDLIIQREHVVGTSDRISTTLAELVDAVRPGDPILLADGRLSLEVVEVDPPTEIRCRVVDGGVVSTGKGVNLPSTELDLSPLTEKDLDDLEWISTRDFAYVALSFVQRAGDIDELRRFLDDAGLDAHIIAKIEKPRALDEIDEIIEAADAIMLARGDLGVEMDFAAVPVAQKRVAQLCLVAGKTLIVATEMLESMISSPRPTRAEASDVANAVFDLADTLMLSAETSIGEFPVEAVDAMARTIGAAEDLLRAQPHGQLDPARWGSTRGVVANTLFGTDDLAAAVIVSDTGTTARLTSRGRPAFPVVALAERPSVARRACLYFGIEPRCGAVPAAAEDLLQHCTDIVKEMGLAEPGDEIAVVASFDEAKRTSGVVVVTVD